MKDYSQILNPLIRKYLQTEDPLVLDQILLHVRDMSKIIASGFKNLNDRDEVISRSMIKAWQAITENKLDQEKNEAGYVFRIVQFTCLDQIKKEKRYSARINKIANSPELLRKSHSQEFCDLQARGVYSIDSNGDK